MKKIMIGSIALGLAVVSQAALVDDFSGDLSAYNNYVILDANGGGANTSAWQINSGALEFTTSTYDGIEQNAFIRDGLTLSVGEEVQTDVTLGAAVDRDIGLYVGNTTPTAGVRQDYVNVYVRLLAGGEYGAVYSRGFDSTEMTLASAGAVTFDKLFIARTASDTYELGYYDGATRTIITTRTTANNAAGAVGFYSNARAVGTISGMDNLQVIPEPATIGLIGVFGVGLLGARRFFRI